VAADFLGYSHTTARTLVERFDDSAGSAGMGISDEQYALTTRAHERSYHPFYNKMLPPTHRDHPAQKVMTEDVYYMHLLFK
jgi:hypothetical protein